MKRFYWLALFLISCAGLKGQPVVIEADGKIDEYEKEMLLEMAKQKTVVRQGEVPFYYLQNHISDMDVFIRRCIYPRRAPLFGLRVKMVRNKVELARAWKRCAGGIFGPAPPVPEYAVAFYCANNYTIVLLEREVGIVIDDYDHEEGHHIHNVSGDVSEFPAEFNRLWKIFIRIAMDRDVGEAYFDHLYEYPPKDQSVRTIEAIGKYRSGALMFFMVMNYFNADFTETARFMFESSGRMLRKFFRSRLDSYPTHMTVREIWEKETYKLFDQGFIYKNIKALRNNPLCQP